jgi:hypothetical protein
MGGIEDTTGCIAYCVSFLDCTVKVRWLLIDMGVEIKTLLTYETVFPMLSMAVVKVKRTIIFQWNRK